MKRTILLYGFIMACSFAILKFYEQHYMFNELKLDLYIGTLALLFTVLGIWIGIKYVKDKKDSVNDTVLDSKLAEETLETLNISNREKEVLQLIAKGYSNHEIAEKLFLSISTVKTHSSNLFSKLDVKRRTQAVQKAKQLRIIA